MKDYTVGKIEQLTDKPSNTITRTHKLIKELENQKLEQQLKDKVIEAALEYIDYEYLDKQTYHNKLLKAVEEYREKFGTL